MYGKQTDTAYMPISSHNCDSAILCGTYDVLSELGSGGNGTVYKAWHKRLNKHIVLKELKNGTHRTAQAQRNEVEALKGIKSMYIPQVFDFITAGDSTYTAMEYIDGTSFDKLLVQGKQFSAAQVTKWYYQLSSALEALHSKDICHRDIKPANIILMTNGDVNLIDFNSALVNGNNTGIINRSMGYASPEQTEYFRLCEEAHRLSKTRKASEVSAFKELLGASSWPGRIDWKLSDIYSLGATMYHLRTGRHPPLIGEVSQYAAAGCKSTATLPAIIKRSMHPVPSERYTAGELCCLLKDLHHQGEHSW